MFLLKMKFKKETTYERDIFKYRMNPKSPYNWLKQLLISFLFLEGEPIEIDVILTKERIDFILLVGSGTTRLARRIFNAQNADNP